METQRHSVWGEGTDAGFLGGTAVAVLFLFRDLIHGKPLLTPSVLGQVLVFGSATPNTTSIDFAAVVLYTAAHFIVFLGVGFLATMLTRVCVRQPAALIGLLILFAIFEVAFYVVLQTVTDEVSRLFPLLWVLGANLLATLVMGIYLWRRYPELQQALKREPLGA